MTAPVLVVDGVTKSFRIPTVRRDTIREHALAFFRPRPFERLEVLRGISFEVARGETLGIMGRNGSGKSTLLRVLCGIYPPDRGSVTRRAAITPVLELGVGWNAELDAVDNVYLLGAVMGLRRSRIKRELHEILAFAELERFAKLELKHYSTGMAMRLAYSVAFHAVRDVLILDEVFAVGDAGFVHKCEQRHAALRNRGCTTILVSHNPRLIAEKTDRVLVLENGRIAFQGDPQEAVQRYLQIAEAAVS